MLKAACKLHAERWLNPPPPVFRDCWMPGLDPGTRGDGEGSNLAGGGSDGKNSEAEACKIGRGKKIPDWSGDGGDIFYLLTEESKAISSGCNQSIVEGSTSSESESVSSVVGPTVRPQRQHRKCIKSRSGSTVGAELSGQNARALKWDYSGTGLMGLEKDSKFDSLPNVDVDEDCQAPSTNATSTDAKMLQMIYNTIRELQTETRAESQRARIATKQLQGTVCKVARTCTEIEEKLITMENRTAAVESEVEALKEQVETHGGQLTDIKWKLEDYENRQRRNNLRFWGIEEWVEGLSGSVWGQKKNRDVPVIPPASRPFSRLKAGTWFGHASPEAWRLMRGLPGASSLRPWVGTVEVSALVLSPPRVSRCLPRLLLRGGSFPRQSSLRSAQSGYSFRSSTSEVVGPLLLQPFLPQALREANGQAGPVGYFRAVSGRDSTSHGCVWVNTDRPVTTAHF
ncbi:hypothetical protein NDU88_007814 [Pleurodeles waltl]|uniref:Uncharacterized protein n=1 Tax=Pleurodeles waltl TaxID=8319 RepID=A0AAV7N7Z2_PLEWA|nr:hypothetical protein NDU88_007814 [Pleurodeles waltl]